MSANGGKHVTTKNSPSPPVSRDIWFKIFRLVPTLSHPLSSKFEVGNEMNTVRLGSKTSPAQTCSITDSYGSFGIWCQMNALQYGGRCASVALHCTALHCTAYQTFRNWSVTARHAQGKATCTNGCNPLQSAAKIGLKDLRSRGAVAITALKGLDVDDWSACQHIPLPEWVEAMCCGENVLWIDEGAGADAAMSSILDAHHPKKASFWGWFWCAGNKPYSYLLNRVSIFHSRFVGLDMRRDWQAGKSVTKTQNALQLRGSCNKVMW